MRLRVFVETVFAVGSADARLATTSMEALHGLKVFTVNISLPESNFVAGTTARDLLFQPRRSVTAHRPGLEGVQLCQASDPATRGPICPLTAW